MPKGTKGFPKGYTPHNKGVEGYTNSGSFQQGEDPWNKGIPMGEAAKKKLSCAKRGTTAWNKGLKTGPLSEETRQKLSEAGKRKIFTAEHRANLSKALKGRKTPWSTANFSYENICVSNLTYKLAEVLETCGFNVAIEQLFWPYTVDVLLLDKWIAFEADGNYWHDPEWLKRTGRTPNKLTDIERDQRLFAKHQLPVVRLGENEVNKLHAALVKR